MPKPLPQDALTTLREVNAHLRSALVRLHHQGQHCSNITAQDFSNLRKQIQRASGWVRNISLNPEAAVELKKESSEYVGNLEKLKHILPEFHGRLLIEKSRIEAAKNHLSAVAAWAESRTKTL